MVLRICIVWILFFSGTLLSQSSKIDSLQNVVKSVKGNQERGEVYLELLNLEVQENSDDFDADFAEAIAFAKNSGLRDYVIKYGIASIKRLRLQRNGEVALKRVDSLMPFIVADSLFDLQEDLLLTKGWIYGDIPDYANAASAFFERIPILKKIDANPERLARAYHRLGWAVMNSNNHQKALEYFDISLDLQEQFETTFRPNTLWNVGICYMEIDDFDQALEVLNQGVNEALKTGNNDAAAGNQTCIASVYVRQSKFQEGLTAYEKAYTMAVDADQPAFKIIETLNGIIYSYNQLATPYKAVSHIAMADSLIAANDYSEIRTREFLFHKTNNLLQRGLPREADEVFLKYERAYDTIRERNNQRIIQEKETEFRTKEKEQELLLKEEELKNQRLYSIALGGGSLLLGLIGFLVFRQQKSRIRHQKQEQELKEALLKVETKNKLEEQRKRISKELHDNIGSQLTYISSSAKNIGLKLKDHIPDDTLNSLDQLSEFSNEAITDLRDTIWVMNHNTVGWNDLKERIQYLSYKVSSATDLEVKVEQLGSSDQTLKPEDTLNVFRIIQEAINNVVKHAQASLITITLNLADTMAIQIADNGKGYDPLKITSASVGLESMKARARSLKGNLAIETSNQGTIITLTLP